MALGAPCLLLESVQQAALDEVRHARDAFSRASLYAGRAIQPSPFPEVLLPERGPLKAATLAIESFVDGCIGETVAARTLQRASTRVSDPSLRQMLARTALEEAQHASLAWEIVAWCARRGDFGTPAMLRAAILSLNAFPASERAEPTTEKCSASLCALMGRLLPGEELALRRTVEEESRNSLSALLT